MNAKKTEEWKVFKSRLYLSTHSSIWKSKTGPVGFENQHVLDYSVEQNFLVWSMFKPCTPKTDFGLSGVQHILGCF